MQATPEARNGAAGGRPPPLLGRRQAGLPGMAGQMGVPAIDEVDELGARSIVPAALATATDQLRGWRETTPISMSSIRAITCLTSVYYPWGRHEDDPAVRRPERGKRRSAL